MSTVYDSVPVYGGGGVEADAQVRENSRQMDDGDDDLDDEAGRLIEEETALTGRVQWGVYYDYAKSIGVVGAILAIFFYALGQTLHTLSNVWLSFWSDYNQNHTPSEIGGKLG